MIWVWLLCVSLVLNGIAAAWIYLEILAYRELREAYDRCERSFYKLRNEKR